MCLTIPKKVINIKGELVFLETADGKKQKAKTIIKLHVGDFCLTQQNIVIQKIGKREAKEIINLIKK